MRHRIILNFDFSGKLYDKKIHDQLVFAMQHVPQLKGELVHVWQNSIWVTDDLDIMGALSIGSELQKQFPKKALSFAMFSDHVQTIHRIRGLCYEEAKKAYDAYVSRSQTTLFGSEGLSSFEALPQFFTQGTTITI